MRCSNRQLGEGTPKLGPDRFVGPAHRDSRLGPGAEDMPFLGPNAALGASNHPSTDRDGGIRGRQFLRLQATQTVLLNFADLSSPHVSVATLRKVT